MSRPGTDDQLDPREEEVRRRLADARHVEPVPVDVAGRLDRVLAELAAGEDVPSSVDELAVRRRRRAAGLLAAAAVVTVAGLGLGQVLPGSGGSDDSGSAADSVAGLDRDAAGRSTAAKESAAAEPGDGAGGGSAANEGKGEGLAAGAAVPEAATTLDAFVTPPGRPVRVRPERFAADALRARDVVDGGRDTDRGRPGGGKRRDGEQTFFECTPADWGPGVAVPVLYDDEPHVLVFRAPAGDSQVADLLQCGTGEILRSTTLPAG
ncbi:hypothetical protein [Nocardioides abyssi]|uniref:Uncharacterized protein n=1 Tax=Nocardioides abyssi TaxID=3058370 RepID=A0ABT8ESR1_9ACTN|nr:hypothetical protein [Nocardioides abyssi]MDN4161159.1 hypothetical protein [Nocardioides abyssi]